MAAPSDDWADAPALLTDCPRVLLSVVGPESGATDRTLGVTASGEPYEGAGEPYAGGASLAPYFEFLSVYLDIKQVCKMVASYISINVVVLRSRGRDLRR